MELHPAKTRLIEFGRFAARDRAARGEGKPAVLEVLGFRHACANKSTGYFVLRRHTSKRRMRAKLSEVKTELRRRQHLPIPAQGRWLASVIRGHCNYYGVPGNSNAINAFRDQATRHWYWALKRRSQRDRLNWERMRRIQRRWLPPAHITHPKPLTRFDAKTQGRSPVR